MAVQIPRVQRFQPQAPTSVGRIDPSIAPDLVSAEAPRRKAEASLVGAVAEVAIARDEAIRKAELKAKDLKATELNNQLSSWAAQRREQIALKKGDVTQDYKLYDEEYAQQIETVRASMPDDPETIELFNSKLQSTNSRLNELRNIQQMKQNFAYQKSVADSTVKIRQDEAMKFAEMFTLANPATFAPMDQAIRQIEQTRAAEGEMNGFPAGIRINEAGVEEREYSPFVQAQISSDVSDVVRPIVKSLNAAGKSKESKRVIEEYSKYLTAADRAALIADSDESDVKNQALDLVSKLEVQSGTAAFDAINKSQASEAVKFKAREIVNTNDMHMENARRRKRVEGYNVLYNHLDEKQRSNQPYVNVNEFKDSQWYKNYRDVLTPQELKSLEQRIDAPATSDPKVKEKIQGLIQSGQFARLKPVDLNAALAGLNREDRNRYEALWNSAIKPPPQMTESQAASRLSRVNKQFWDDARLSGLIPKSGEPGTWSQQDREYYSKLEADWLNFYTDNVAQENMSIDAQNATVRQFINNYLNTNPPPKKGWFQRNRVTQQLPELTRRTQVPNSPALVNENTTVLGPKSVTKPAPKSAAPANNAVDLDTMSVEQFQYWEDQYIKDTGASAAPEDRDEFQAWINKKVSK